MRISEVNLSDTRLTDEELGKLMHGGVSISVLKLCRTAISDQWIQMIAPEQSEIGLIEINGTREHPLKG